ncbi:MAG TPA: hypothetical protein PLX50_02840, partial [Candidatus Aminicenantes bacterium]|nr:hypothetical protein [Candidatus Aminicenantes bacterium]
ILFNSLQGFNLMDIMFRIFSALGPPTMLPLICGLLFKKVNSRGSIWGLIAGATTGAVLVVTNFFLVQMYAEQMKVNPSMEFWLRSGWNSVATVVGVIATIAGMWLGTRSRPTPAEEKEKSEAFFVDLQKPFLYEEKAEKPLSPFRIIGFMLIFFGLLIAAIAFLVLGRYKDARAFKIEFAVSLALIIIGFLMRLGKRKE